MATVQNNQSPTLRRAQMMREAWRPVGARISGSSHRTWDYMVAHPPLIQGVYFALTGLWPWVHLDSFLAVTGPKTDLWLVQTVGALIFVIGAVLCVAAYFREVSRAVVCLAVGSAAALALVDVLFVTQGRISAIYLLDAVLEVGLIGLWLHAWRTGHIQFVPAAVVTAQVAPEAPVAAAGAWQPAPAPGPEQTVPAVSAQQTIGHSA
jgi:hypothetical protein